MSPDDRWRVRQMIDSAQSALRFVSGRARDDLDADQMLLFAVVRAVEILGEAASKVSEEVRSAHGEIPWGAIIGMRNRLVHAYFEIDTGVVWVAVTEEIPDLLLRCRRWKRTTSARDRHSPCAARYGTMRRLVGAAGGCACGW